MDAISADDEGKDVVNESGETIGLVVEVDTGRAYVEPDPALTDAIMSKLGWGRRGDGTYLLEADLVDSVTDDQVRTHSL